MTTTRWPCIVLATLCLLALATSVSAECAWILWSDVVTGTWDKHNVLTAQDHWTVIEGFLTKTECVAAVKACAGTTFSREGFETLYFRCLPDTVDPRASKGK